MARSIHRRWTADDVTKLRQLAGKHPRNAIAAQLGRGPSALAVKAHQLKVSLRVSYTYIWVHRDEERRFTPRRVFL